MPSAPESLRIVSLEGRVTATLHVPFAVSAIAAEAGALPATAAATATPATSFLNRRNRTAPVLTAERGLARWPRKRMSAIAAHKAGARTPLKQPLPPVRDGAQVTTRPRI